MGIFNQSGQTVGKQINNTLPDTAKINQMLRLAIDLAREEPNKPASKIIGEIWNKIDNV